MRLLFDHNISPDLVRRLTDLFPDSKHVFALNLHETDDRDLWRYAREHGFSIVSKDADFAEISMIDGYPPKLIWLRLGNCATNDIERVMRSNAEAIQQMGGDTERGILSLFAR